MNSEEYERRKRLLDEQLRADLELIRAGHEARLRALDALRDGSRGETLATLETQTAETQTGAAPAVPAVQRRTSSAFSATFRIGPPSTAPGTTSSKRVRS
ncbi:MAG: hypothetical protein DMF53_29110 [Acidobacteria bacterium]|nr:MAG: hypothetical protein DMF53_29110 [Acidobacteriota bacterium]